MKKKNKAPDHIAEEAEAFDKRLEERDRAGFIPDLRDAIKCDFFYKSFFRDPYFMRLYQGRIAEWFVNGLQEHRGRKLDILDVGCGPGQITLELARNGHRVVGIDISKGSISLAQRTAKNNRHKKNFGSLDYSVLPFEEVEGKYDALVFCGSLHHFSSISKVVKKAHAHLKPGGLLLCYEPCHEQFTKQDAAQVAMFKMILSITGFWYEKEVFKTNTSPAKAIDAAVKDVHFEYISEQDKHEQKGQSPHDNSSSGAQILKSLNKHFVQKEYISAFSFIYRFLGGMRGPDSTIYRLADLFAAYDRYGLENGFLRPNTFFYIGKKR
jgi:2-polyprenyl-3-methyl-5-hydroxy-6-metoxy-1,4-benzoquinol methylase